MKIFFRERTSAGMTRVKRYLLFGHTVLYKEKSPDRYKVKLLGLNVFMRTIGGRKRTYYLFGMRLWRRRTGPALPSVAALAAAPARAGGVTFRVESEPLVSIIIPVFNQVEYTKKCLTSIFEHGSDVSYEVIIADDASTDGTKNLASYARNAVIVRGSGNVGYIRNCNSAARRARGKYLYFLNNDVVVREGWLSALVETFERHKDAGVVGSRVVRPDGTLQECGVYVFADGYRTCIVADPYLDMNSYFKKADYVSGCSLMTPARLFRDIGGFDERFSPAYCDDPDYCFEVARRGFGVYVQPRSEIIHFGSQSYEGRSEALQIRNNRMLREKWPGFFASRTSYAPEKMPFSGKTRPPTILVMDEGYPEYDRHAGGRSVFQFIRTFVSMGLCVKFCALFAAGPEEPYHAALCDMGVEVLGREEAERMLYRGAFLDYVLFSRPGVIRHFMTRPLMARGAGVFYYGHDAHFLRMERERLLSGTPEKADVEAMKRLETAIVSSVDVAWYPSEEEAALFRSLAPGAEVRALTPYMYDVSSMPEHAGFEQSDGLVFVGSSHGPNLDGLLWFVREVLPLIRERVPGVTLHVVGSGDFEKERELVSPAVRLEGRLDEKSLADLYRRMKVSVAPLRFGAGVKGKVVEALYYGVPVVTTAAGAEGMAATPLMTVSDDARAMADAVADLCLNEERWNGLRALYAPYLEEHFSERKAEEEFRRFISVEPRSNEMPEY